MDLENGEDFIKMRKGLNVEIEEKIKLIYIFNNKNFQGMKRAAKIRSSCSHKIKGVIMDLNCILSKVKQ